MSQSNVQLALYDQLLQLVERIAFRGDPTAIQDLLAMTTHPPHGSPQLAALAEAIARMVVKLEAREYELECIIEDLQATKAELERANYDPLTGLPNRVIARDRLHQGLLQAKRTGGQLAVLYMDLDKFKAVNDQMGHAAGDELLQQVAQRGRTCIRAMDTVARLGGDEFACVLPALDSPVLAEQLAQRFVDVMHQPFALRDGEAHIGASVGIAYYPAHGSTAAVLLECADVALYHAKRAGRNVFRVFNAEHESSP